AAPVLARRTSAAAAQRRESGPAPSFSGRSAASGPPSRLPVIIAGVFIVVSAGFAFYTLRPAKPPEPQQATPAPVTPAPATPSPAATATVAGPTKPAAKATAPAVGSTAAAGSSPATTQAPTAAPLV